MDPALARAALSVTMRAAENHQAIALAAGEEAGLPDHVALTFRPAAPLSVQATIIQTHARDGWRIVGVTAAPAQTPASSTGGRRVAAQLVWHEENGR
jgi:hypothetical protein